MSRFLPRATTALGLSLAALAPAHAQVSEAFDRMFAQAEENGATVTFGDKVEDGGAVTYTDLTITGEDGVEIAYGDFAAAPGDGGTVVFTVPSPVTITTPDGFTAEVRSVNWQSVLTPGSEGDAYETTADSVEFEVVDAPAPGTLALSLTDVTGDFLYPTAGARDASVDLTAASGSVEYDIPDTGSAGATNMTDLTVSFSLTQPETEGLEDEDMLAAFTSGEAGFRLALSSGASEGTSRISVPVPYELTGSAGAGEFAIGLSDGRFGMFSSTDDVDYDVSISGAPFPPFDLQASTVTISADLPTAKTGEAAVWSTVVTLADLTVSESLWGVVDPGQALPRDPATLDIALSGEMTVVAAPNEPFFGPPAMPNSIDIERARLAAVGAEVTAEGGAIFDMSRGAPIPTGSVNVSISGANTLIQRLADAGLVPPQQAGMARGMLGMFAVPSGDDGYTTELVFSESGVTANGVPLQ